MFEDLKDRRVLVTGSTAGIGLEVARAFLAAGAKVVLHGSRSPSQAESLLSELSAPGRVFYLQADVRETAQCEALVKQAVEAMGGLDVLVNNAGGLGGRQGLESIDDDFFDNVIDLNIRSVVMVTRFAIEPLRASARQSGQSSSVITTGSIAGREGGGLGACLYGGSKAMVHNLHRNWVKEFTKDSIRFNTVAPGTIDTAFHADKSDALKQTIAGSIAMGRFGECQEMAPTYLYLASHAASGYVTGQVIDVNGGQMCP
ncbi:SDR family NAD(P)-dependent oxidoreductase [Cobetia sp. 3AK]|uniref:SDR family NAD(P)-dependent oxidoreductase n=1 Tax=Cobetia TaxID=204286 RepID=UPI00244D5F6D|nr:SDR family NAD(P)-dependent oxidoreductase [Cobetia sp. 3AK]MDH2373999.1 SDR family NAD(P)-dependent oxidoreductase [Cobetia sp. 3AK]